MNFDSFEAFLAMGEHGFYVWFSYALALGVVVYNIAAPVLRKRRFLAALRGRLRRAGEAPDATIEDRGTRGGADAGSRAAADREPHAEPDATGASAPH